VANLGIVALVAAGAVFATAVSASADSPNPGATQTGTAVLNGDGSITVTVTASWVWDNKSCDEIVTEVKAPDKIPGYAVSWGDNTANELGSTGIFVGDASDNAVHTPGTSCDDSSGDAVGTFTDTVSHTYAPGTTEINPCVVTYDVRDDAETGKHSRIAGGADNNSDNSVEENKESPADGCVPVVFEPDVSIVKTGPTSAVVGTPFSYTLTATNTGAVAADPVVITDVIPANTTFVSASAPCTFDSGTATVTCDEGSLGLGANVAATITVVPTVAGQDIVNTGTVTPEDATPNDNTSTWTISGINVLPADATKPVTPPVTPAAIVAAPTFTG
jgi:uncharacterized repeat protein (TIGR01451 family)